MNDAGCKQSDEEFVFILESILKKMAWIGVTYVLSDDISSPLIVKNIETVRTLKYGVEEKEKPDH